MLEDNALEEPWSCEAKLFRRLFLVSFLFSQETIQAKPQELIGERDRGCSVVAIKYY